MGQLVQTFRTKVAMFVYHCLSTATLSAPWGEEWDTNLINKINTISAILRSQRLQAE